ncbi:hypothetical protein RSAG8_02634, partial [Rhizoctonia solani AG-8 WAC10335]
MTVGNACASLIFLAPTREIVELGVGYREKQPWRWSIHIFYLRCGTRRRDETDGWRL